MSGKQFLLREPGGLEEMPVQPYAKEDRLQELLANHPQLIPSDLGDGLPPRRWLLIRREVSLPDEAAGSGYWSLDHVFLDQDAVPTIVEAKRSSDSRLRREVVAQMLDYAANSVLYLPIDRLRADFESRCVQEDQEPELTLQEFLGSEGDLEDFWQTAKTNLQAGRVRLLFIADEIPEKLQRIIEFLNVQMDPATVLAVEVKQFVGEASTVLSSTLIGQTAEARQRKRAGSPSKDRMGFIERLARDGGENDAFIARDLLDGLADLGLSKPNVDAKNDAATCWPVMAFEGKWYYPVTIQAEGRVIFNIHTLRRIPTFESAERRKDILDRLNAELGVNLPDRALHKPEGFPLSVLSDRAALDTFLRFVSEVIQGIRGANGAPTVNSGQDLV